MSKVVVACETIKSEVFLAIRETGVDYPVIFIDSGLHNHPDMLKEEIQRQINRIDNVDTIIMAFGFCGNGLLGIKSLSASLVIPRADDCISLMLGSYGMKKAISKGAGAYFLTKGWLESESNIITEYEKCVTRYGQDKALKIMKIMLKNYSRLVLIDTKTYRLEDIIHITRLFAEKMGMIHEEAVGSTRFFNKLLLGPWDDEFILLKPGQELRFEDMCLNDGNTSMKDEIVSNLTFCS